MKSKINSLYFHNQAITAFTHLINVKPKVELGGGGGGPRAYVGHLTSIAHSTLGNLTKSMGPRVGTFDFLCRGMRPSYIVTCACLCGRPSSNISNKYFFGGKHLFLTNKTTSSHY